MGTFTGIKITNKNILFKFHVVSLVIRVRPSHQKSDAKSVFFMSGIPDILVFSLLFKLPMYTQLHQVKEEQKKNLMHSISFSVINARPIRSDQA